jgi:Na+-transporting methylmalonyl-CoA/oxaloacetate decarboxylase gamma subunit
LLVAVSIILAVAVWRLSAAASANREIPGLRVYLVRMTYLFAVLLMLTMSLLAMRGVRWVVGRFKSPPPAEPTSQVSAWVEAGKRFELPEVEQVEGDEGPSEP